MTRWAFFAARAAVAAFCLLTWAYGLIVSVRFAFEQFIRPQSVSMGHAVRDLAPCVVLGRVPGERGHVDSRSPGPPGDVARRAAGWLAVGYLLFFGAIGVHLLGNPYLVTLDGGERSLTIVPGALLPLLWLAVIDHLGARFPRDQRPQIVTGQRRLFAACLATAVSVWLLHVGVTALRSDISGGWAARMATVVWALALDVAAAPGRVCRRQPGGVDRGHTAAGLRVGIRLRRGARSRSPSPSSFGVLSCRRSPSGTLTPRSGPSRSAS